MVPSVGCNLVTTCCVVLSQSKSKKKSYPIFHCVVLVLVFLVRYTLVSERRFMLLNLWAGLVLYGDVAWWWWCYMMILHDDDDVA